MVERKRTQLSLSRSRQTGSSDLYHQEVSFMSLRNVTPTVTEIAPHIIV